jgi:hypothetical protein
MVQQHVAARRENEKNYNKHQVDIRFDIGDVVLCWWPHHKAEGKQQVSSKKLKGYWNGPWIVKNQSGAYNYVIQKDDVVRHVHVQHLAKYYPEIVAVAPEDEDDWYRIEIAEKRNQDWISTRAQALKDSAAHDSASASTLSSSSSLSTSSSATSSPVSTGSPTVETKSSRKRTHAAANKPAAQPPTTVFEDGDDWRKRAGITPAVDLSGFKEKKFRLNDMVIVRLIDPSGVGFSLFLAEVTSLKPLTVHTYRSFEPASKGPTRKYFKSWWCPKTKKDAYTDRPKDGYEPWDLVVTPDNIVTDGFALHKKQIPLEIFETALKLSLPLK